MRVKYATNKVNELVLIKSGAMIDTFEEEDEDRRYVVSWRWYRYKKY